MIITNLIAALLYVAIGIYGALQIIQYKNPRPPFLLIGVAIALVLHAMGILSLSSKAEGFQLSFFAVSSQIFWVTNLVVLFSCIRKNLYVLFIILLPFSALAILLAYFSHSTSSILQLNNALAMHVLLSIFAYSLFTIATLLAIMLAYQNHQLKSKTHLNYLKHFPPLQTMEELLFDFLVAGEILLTLSIISGAVIFENLFAQHLVHKTILGIVAWLIYAFLIFAKYQLGWRGMTAIRWTLAGFIFLMLAYFGSKLVLEIILHRV